MTILGWGLDPRAWSGILLLVILIFVARRLRSRILSIVLFILLIFQLMFFRDPVPKIPAGDQAVSPANGSVIAVDSAIEDRFLKEDAWRIRISLKLWNVHVNRAPMDGKIIYQKHEMGKHLNALTGEAFRYNESNWIGIEKGDRRILVRQMTGAVARRIFSDVSVGNDVSRGQKLGVICYGSGVEVYIPKRLFDPMVKIGQSVDLGETVLGDWRTEGK